MADTNVLIVEDERHVAKLIEYFLTKAGFSVKAFDSAEKALESVNRDPPAALILDLNLPGMSGLEFLSLLREDPRLKDVVVIVLTGHWFDSDDLTIEKAGANAHCTKPVSPTTLIRLLADFGVRPDRSSE